MQARLAPVILTRVVRQFLTAPGVTEQLVADFMLPMPTMGAHLISTTKVGYSRALMRSRHVGVAAPRVDRADGDSTLAVKNAP
jgi:hypothetical protein